MFKKKSVASIVASIVKMRTELKEAIQQNREEIKIADNNIEKAVDKCEAEIKIAEDKMAAEVSKQDSKKAQCEQDIAEANKWLNELPGKDQDEAQ